MKKISLIWMALLLMVASNAVGEDVKYNFDKNTDFSKFKTYKWVSLKDAATVDALLDKQIKEAVDAQLATKGLSKVDGDADLFIDYQSAITTEKQFTTYNNNLGNWGPAPGWGPRGGWYGAAGMGGGVTTGNTSTIYIGQLALDMNDTANHDLVWRGVVSKTIDPKAKPPSQAAEGSHEVSCEAPEELSAKDKVTVGLGKPKRNTDCDLRSIRDGGQACTVLPIAALYAC